MRRNSRTTIIEICGMPGSGKSTVYHSIKKEPMNVQFGYRISINNDWRTIALEMIKLLPTYIMHGFRGFYILRIKFLVHLKVLYKIFTSGKHSLDCSLLFDQGPLFHQTFLLAIGSSFLPNKYLKLWVNRSISNWSDIVGGIIWLDAKDVTLVERVKKRNQTHSLKTRTNDEQREFLVGYRSAYRNVISRYEQKGIPVLRLDTEKDNVAVTKVKIIQFLSMIESNSIE